MNAVGMECVAPPWITEDVVSRVIKKVVLIFTLACADPESFVRGGPTLTTFFLVDEEREDPNAIISGPSSASSKTPFKWHFASI